MSMSLVGDCHVNSIAQEVMIHVQHRAFSSQFSSVMEWSSKSIDIYLRGGITGYLIEGHGPTFKLSMVLVLRVLLPRATTITHRIWTPAGGQPYVPKRYDCMRCLGKIDSSSRPFKAARTEPENIGKHMEHRIVLFHLEAAMVEVLVTEACRMEAVVFDKVVPGCRPPFLQQGCHVRDIIGIRETNCQTRVQYVKIKTCSCTAVTAGRT